MLVEANGAVGGAIKTNGEAHSDDDDPKEPKEEIPDDENYVEDQQPNKRVKTGKRDEQGKKETKKLVRPAEPVCEICLQKLNDEDLRLYIGHPNNAVDEYSVLLDPKLCLFNGDELDITEADARALNKVTCFR